MHRQTLVELYRGRESFSEGGANPVGRSIIEDGEVGRPSVVVEEEEE